MQTIDWIGLGSDLLIVAGVAILACCVVGVVMELLAWLLDRWS